MNQRRHLLALARKGDQKAVNQLMELYQVRVYSGDSLKSLKIRKSLPVLNPPKPKDGAASAKPKPVKRHKGAAPKPKAAPKVKPKAAPKAARVAVTKAKSASPKPTRSKGKVSPKLQPARPKAVRKPKPAKASPKKTVRTVPSKGVTLRQAQGKLKSGTRRPTAGTRVQPRTQAQSKAKAKSRVKSQVKAKPRAAKKAKSGPASKAKRQRRHDGVRSRCARRRSPGTRLDHRLEVSTTGYRSGALASGVSVRRSSSCSRRRRGDLPVGTPQGCSHASNREAT